MLRLVLSLVVCWSVAAAVFSGGALAAEGQNFTIGGSTISLMATNLPASPLNLTFSNPNDDAVAVSILTVAIVSVTAPNASAGFPCSTADYSVTQFSGFFPVAVPPGSSSSLQSIGYPQSAWPAVKMLETGVNQNGCEGATVNLAFSAVGQDGPAVTTPPVTTTTTTTTAASTGAAAAVTTTTTAGTTTTAPLTPPAAPKSPSIALTPASQSISGGGKATFKITVKNTTGTQLTGVAVSDPLATGCSRALGTLAAGASRSYVCSRSGVQAAFTDGATVRGTTPAGSSVSASASAKVKLTAALTPPLRARITIALTPRSQTLTTEIVTHKTLSTSSITTTRGRARFTIKVTNAGTGSLHSVTVADTRARSCKRSLGTLAAGASRSFVCTVKSVRQGFTNVAVAAGKSPTGAKVTATARAAVKVRTKRATITTLTIPDVLFAFNESTLRPGANGPLETILKALTVAYPVGHITITGYTDSIGSVAYNLDLSRRRATTVADWLEQRGIPTARVTVAWKGKADPVATNATAQGRQQNRRVTVAIRTNH